MEQIDLSRLMQPLHPLFGGNGEVLAYSELDASAELDALGERSFVIHWSARGLGFGQAYLSDHNVDAETMSRNFIAAVLRRFVLDAAWSHEGHRYEAEDLPERLQVRLANQGGRVGLQYASSLGDGTIYLGKGYRNYGEVNWVDVTASKAKSEFNVVAVLMAWLNSIPEWA